MLSLEGRSISISLLLEVEREGGFIMGLPYFWERKWRDNVPTVRHEN